MFKPPLCLVTKLPLQFLQVAAWMSRRQRRCPSWWPCTRAKMPAELGRRLRWSGLSHPPDFCWGHYPRVKLRTRKDVDNPWFNYPRAPGCLWEMPWIWSSWHWVWAYFLLREAAGPKDRLRQIQLIFHPNASLSRIYRCETSKVRNEMVNMWSYKEYWLRPSLLSHGRWVFLEMLLWEVPSPTLLRLPVKVWISIDRRKITSVLSYYRCFKGFILNIIYPKWCLLCWTMIDLDFELSTCLWI